MLRPDKPGSARRARRRWHTDRIKANRWRLAKQLLGNSRVLGRHPEEVRREGAIRVRLVGRIYTDDGWPFDRPWGELDDELAWVGCRRARCGMCGADAADDRRREERDWQARELGLKSNSRGVV